MKAKIKTFSVLIQVLEDVMHPSTDEVKMQEYLTQMLEIPQHPDAEPGQPFYPIAVTIGDIVLEKEVVEVTEDTEVEKLIQHHHLLHM